MAPAVVSLHARSPLPCPGGRERLEWSVVWLGIWIERRPGGGGGSRPDRTGTGVATTPMFSGPPEAKASPERGTAPNPALITALLSSTSKRDTANLRISERHRSVRRPQQTGREKQHDRAEQRHKERSGTPEAAAEESEHRTPERGGLNPRNAYRRVRPLGPPIEQRAPVNSLGGLR